MSHVTDFTSGWAHVLSDPNVFNRTDGHRVKLFEESVTFIAQLQNDDGSTMVPPLDRTWAIGNWRIGDQHFPIIIAVSSCILILLLMAAVLTAWRCCRHQKLQEKKNFAMHMNVEDGRAPVFSPANNSTLTRSYPSILVMPLSKPGSPLMVQSKLANQELISLTAETPTGKRKVGEMVRRQSQEQQQLHQQQQQQQEQETPARRSCDDMSQVGMGCYVGFDLPEIPEYLNASNSASSGILDQSATVWTDGNGSLLMSDDPSLRTRSLPAWVRNKGQLQSNDPLVGRNAIKETPVTHRGIHGPLPKRHHHHTLRHDTAALIALSKTKHNADADAVQQDRVSLVTNEAVIVFDERTAL